jgi:GT2 family glycosyltransferase
VTAIILVNYQSYGDTVECVESLLNMGDDNFKIFIIDNSDEKSKQREFITSLNLMVQSKAIANSIEIFQSSENFVLSRTCSLISLINSKNEGFAAANNIVLKRLMNSTDFKYIWLLNNDTKVPEYAVGRYVEEYQDLSKSMNIGLLGCVLVYHSKNNIIQGVGGRYYKFLGTSNHVLDGCELSKLQTEHPFKIDYPIGASMFTSIEFLREIGLMEEDYFLYFEELDWVMRASKKGWVTSYTPKIVVEHKAGQTIGGKNKVKKRSSELSDYYFYRNRIRFSYRFTPFHFPFVLMTVFATVCFRALKGRVVFLRLFIDQKLRTVG